MSKQNNMKRISIILGVLLVLLIALKLKDRKQGDRSFKAYIMQVDTAKVDAIKIHLKPDGQVVNLTKDGKNWMMDFDGKKVQADRGNVYDILSQVNQLKPKQVVATSKNKWRDYEVDDSLGSRVELLNGNKPLADFVIGKFSYSQPKGQNPYMQQRQNVIMTSYVRNSNENNVYAVNGYLSMLFNRQLTSFRDNGVVLGDPANWTKLIYTYPDSSFTLLKQQDHWMVDGMLADSAAVAKYFSQIRMLTDQNFDDESVINDNPKAIYTVRIEGNNLSSIVVKGIKNNMGEIVYTSSINKGNLFKSDKIKEALFVPRERFIKK